MTTVFLDFSRRPELSLYVSVVADGEAAAEPLGIATLINGRIARLLAVLMGLQAGLPPLDFSPLEGRGKARYIAGIHAALDRDYAPLAETFLRVIARTWKRAASNEQ